MTIAITGAAGHLGRLVLAALADRNDVVALVRDPDKAEGLGAPARAFDYDRADTLAPALAGVDTLLLISGNAIGSRVPQHRNVIDAARAAGVGRIAYTSMLRADTSPIGLAAEHVATERMLAESGLPCTLLRNGSYFDNHTAGIPGGVAAGALVGSAGTGRISAASRADYAAAAAAVLTGEGHAGKVYELAGDTAFTMADLAAEVSRRAGRDIPYRDLPVAEYAKILEGLGYPAPVAAGFADWDAGAARGALFDDGRRLSALIGRPTGTLAEAVAAVLP